MSGAPGQSRFAFLYRTDGGQVDARTWARACVPLLAILLPATVVWVLLQPVATRGLDQRRLLDPATLAANLYTLGFALLVILIGVSWVNLSAKRFRDAGFRLPLGAAGVLPLAIVVDGALHWLQPRVGDAIPRLAVIGGDIVVAAILIWTLLTCSGLLRRR